MYGNILLIGGTTYLGSHIAYEFLKQNIGDIYFLVRNNSNVPSRYKLLQALKFYFGDKFISKMDRRIKVITGDITANENLGISKEEFKDTVSSISTVINSSGAYVENIIKFCTKCGKRFLHISTTSISGNLERAERISHHSNSFNDKKTFSETNLYIGQELTSLYKLAKFRAEFKILDAIYDGLDAQILRLGNITNRYSDGFCSNTSKFNAFEKKLKSYIEIGAFPRYLLENSLDFTPIDLAVDAIITILNHSSDCNMFHITESKSLLISLLSQTANAIGIDLVPVSDRLMLDIVNGILGDSDRKHLVSNIIQDFDNNKKLVYDSNIELVSTFTEDYLKNCGFRWKKLDKNYIVKYFNYLKEIGFINF